MMMADAHIASRLTGWPVGDSSGTIICDGCGGRSHLRTPGDSASMTGYVTTPGKRSDGHRLLKLYCTDCDRREIMTSTDGVDELMLSFDVIMPLIGSTAHTESLKVIDRAGP
jgi:hypothetical protein